MDNHLVLSTRWRVKLEASQLWDTMKWEILITAILLTELCHGVTTEPHLQPLSGESLSHRSANTQDGPRLDVAMNGFWGGRFEKAFIDRRMFNPSAQSNRHGPLSPVYRKHEQEARREYDTWDRTWNIHSTSALQNRWNGTSVLYGRLASMLAEKRDIHYSTALNWIRCRLSFENRK